MSVAKNGSARSGGTGFGSSCNTGATVSTTVANCLLIAVFSSGETGLPVTSTISGGGLTWVLLARQSGGGLDTVAEMWFAWAASTITNQTITATFSGNSSGWMAVQAFSGSQDYTSLVANTDYAIVASTAGGGSHDSSTNITSIKSGSWIVQGNTFHDGSTITADTNCAHLSSNPGTFTIVSAFDERTDSPVAIGTYAIGSTADNAGFAGWDAVTLEIVPAAASGAFNPYYYRNIAGHGG